MTTNAAPETEVERVLDLLFSQSEKAGSVSAEAAKISRKTALQNITIPMHPGASGYFGAGPQKKSTS